MEVPPEDVGPRGLPQKACAGRRPDHVPERSQIQAGPLGCNYTKLVGSIYCYCDQEKAAFLLFLEWKPIHTVKVRFRIKSQQTIFLPIMSISPMATTWAQQSMLDMTLGIMAVPMRPVYITVL